MQPKPLPTLDELNRMLLLDPETGHLFWKFRAGNGTKRSHDIAKHFNLTYAGKRADHVLGNGGYTYIRIRVDGKQALFAAHRIIWKMLHGRDPYPVIDHIDRDRTNNHPSNLREATWLENVLNRPAPIRRPSGRPVGVYPTKSGRFRAQVSISRDRVRYFGTFDTAAEALAVINAFRASAAEDRKAA